MSLEKEKALSTNPLALSHAIISNPKITAREVEDWLKSGAGVNIRGQHNSSALILVIQARRSFDVIEFLISKGADVNLRDDHNATALNGRCCVDNSIVRAV